MLDPKLIRDNPKLVKENLKKRGLNESIVDEWIKLDSKLRELKKRNDELRHERNIISEKINEYKKLGQEKEARNAIKKAQELPEKIKELDKEIFETEFKLYELSLKIPNLLDKSVPFGKSSEDNKVIKKFGKAKKFNFKPKDHLELALNLGIIDQERANKVSGHGFYYLKEELALLDHALQKFAIDFLRKKGYKLIEPPLMLHRKPYEGVTNLDAFKDVMYKIQDEDLYLIATSEHAIASMFMDEVLAEKDLPLKFVGISPCFRKEVGSHGKYTKGLFRMHNFNKVEQFIFCKPEDSEKMFLEMQKNSEDMFKALKLPYRVSILCSADTGSVASKTYDIEILMADGKYREAGSNSNCTDYQARRLNIKFLRNKTNEREFVHTLNNTGIATSRVMIAILENNQQADGSIKIPKVLHKYCGFKEIKGK
ncbi:MAG: serine--tRNA ligase [Candidatus Pacearchaeota archaeon]